MKMSHRLENKFLISYLGQAFGGLPTNDFIVYRRVQRDVSNFPDESGYVCGNGGDC